jgi:hypothetical protein
MGEYPEVFREAIQKALDYSQARGGDPAKAT